MTDVTSSRGSHDATDVRYGTRSLLIAMTVVAGVCMALGAFVRSFPTDVRPRLVVHWCILLVLLAAFVAYNARRRYMAEKQAGAVRFLLTPHSYFFPRMPRFARVLLGTFLLLCGPAIWTGTSFLAAENVNALWTQMLSWQAYVAVIASGSGMTYLWWHQKVRVCDQGLVLRHRFIAWSAVRKWFWDPCYRDVIVVKYSESDTVVMKVPAEERDAVAALLESKTSAAIFRALSSGWRTNPEKAQPTGSENRG